MNREPKIRFLTKRYLARWLRRDSIRGRIGEGKRGERGAVPYVKAS